MYLSVATLAQASQMAQTSGSVDQHADLVPSSGQGVPCVTQGDAQAYSKVQSLA